MEKTIRFSQCPQRLPAPRQAGRRGAISESFLTTGTQRDEAGTKKVIIIYPSAAKPQPNRSISRKGAKHARCHFDRREKSFSDPSHSLGMTDRAPSPLRACRPFGYAQDMLGGRKSEAPVIREAETGRKFAQAAKMLKDSSTEFAVELLKK